MSDFIAPLGNGECKSGVLGIKREEFTVGNEYVGFVCWGNEEGKNLLLLGGEGHGIEELDTHSQANN